MGRGEGGGEEEMKQRKRKEGFDFRRQLWVETSLKGNWVDWYVFWCVCVRALLCVRKLRCFCLKETVHDKV